jgi:hypothetical protein
LLTKWEQLTPFITNEMHKPSGALQTVYVKLNDESENRAEIEESYTPKLDDPYHYLRLWRDQNPDEFHHVAEHQRGMNETEGDAPGQEASDLVAEPVPEAEVLREEGEVQREEAEATQEAQKSARARRKSQC